MKNSIECEICQKEISKIAKVCPNCGEPSKAEKRKKNIIGVVALIVVFPWALLIGACVIGAVL